MLTFENKKTIREQFRELPTGVISDAMDDLNIDSGVIGGGLRLLAENQKRAVGFAVTIRQRLLSPGEKGAAVHSQVIEETLGEGDIFVIDVGGCVDVCTGGENLVTRAKAKGAAGWLVNGALRDIEEIKKLDFPIYLAGSSPRRSKGNLTTAGVNVPVTVSGKVIEPGMLIVFDETGIVAVPQDKIEEVYAQAQKIMRRDDMIHAALLAGKSLRDINAVVGG